MPDITGFSHVALTVTDVDQSFEWYERLLGIQKLFEGEEKGIRFCVTMHASSMVILGFRHHQATAEERFDEARVGLDHFAFQVPDMAAMEEWLRRLDELGIEHSEIKDTDYGSVLTFRDPDNIQLEFFVLPGGA